MSFSVAKSYLSTVAGLAIDSGLIGDVHDRVRDYVQDGGFDDSHNRKVTWHMLLNQTSEWEGTLWDKPDVADRRRGYDRKLRAPGTFWEYNDVRVNRLALALLRVYQRPLPEVLKESDGPIGASDTWVWHGYRNSYVEIGARRVQSVSGGSHWGGGFWASTRDLARFGYLLLRRGEWNGRRILSERWVDMATQPTGIAPHYGYLWWCPGTAVNFSVRPSQVSSPWAGRQHDLDCAGVRSRWSRWLDILKLDGFITRMSAALGEANRSLQLVERPRAMSRPGLTVEARSLYSVYRLGYLITLPERDSGAGSSST
jgi:CubicO group peptidase (beta-lactamase class C family)